MRNVKKAKKLEVRNILFRAEDGGTLTTFIGKLQRSYFHNGPNKLFKVIVQHLHKPGFVSDRYTRI